MYTTFKTDDMKTDCSHWISTPERMLLALLRAAMHTGQAEVDVFRTATDADWTACYRLAIKQGVKCLAWDGVQTLPAELHPFEDLRLAWLVAVDRYEQRYAHYCRTIQELSLLYASHGIRTVQIKGVGLSSYYPVPSHREGGDLDIFTSSADAARLTDEQANALADELMRRQGIEVTMHSYKHSNFYYRGVPVENHKCFLNVKRYKVAVQLDDLLQRCLCPEETELQDGECRIFIPSPQFNTLFVAFHGLQHYGSGLSLHHLCDWAVILHKHGLHLPDELTDRPFLLFITALTQLCNRWLGTDIPVTGGEELANEMLHELLRPPFPHKAKVPQGSKWQVTKYKIRRFRHTSRLAGRFYPFSIWKRIGHSIIFHMLHPKKIFG